MGCNAHNFEQDQDDYSDKEEDESTITYFGYLVLWSWTAMLMVSLISISYFINIELGVSILVSTIVPSILLGFPLIIVGMITTVFADKEYKQFKKDVPEH